MNADERRLFLIWVHPRSSVADLLL